MERRGEEMRDIFLPSELKKLSHNILNNNSFVHKYRREEAEKRGGYCRLGNLHYPVHSVHSRRMIIASHRERISHPRLKGGYSQSQKNSVRAKSGGLCNILREPNHFGIGALLVQISVREMINNMNGRAAF